MKKLLILAAGLLLISLNVLADDVSIDSDGNVKTGVSGAGNLEVTGASGEDAIVGRAEDSGAAAVYGEHTVNGQVDNFGILGDDNYGVYGNSLNGDAGFFQGNAHVTGNLTVDGALNASISETDPVFSGSAASGIGAGDITNWNTAFGWGNHAVAGYDTTNDSWTGTGNVYTLSGNVGIGTASPSYKLHVVGLVRTEGSLWSTATTGFGVYGESTSNLGVWGSSSSSSGVRGESSTGAGGYFSSSSGPGLLVPTGNVGIGTSSPGAPFHVSTASDLATIVESTDNVAALAIKDPSGTVAVRTDSGNMTLHAGGYPAEKMRITATGDVGIGTAAPHSLLHLKGLGWDTLIVENNENDPSLQLTSDGSSINNDWTMRMDVSGTDPVNPDPTDDGLQFRYDGFQKMTLTTAGNLGIGTTSPNEKLTVAGTIESTSGGIKFPDGTIQTTAYKTCAGNDATDIMVKVGPICIDKYEASVWSTPSGGTRYGSSDNYPCNDNGNDCSSTNPIYARSQGNALPSTNITWFQAQQACAMSGKRLLTNAEWQMAAAGTPDNSTSCNTSGLVIVTTGTYYGCVSNWGVNDMVGNAWEWVADWIQGDTNPWAPSTGNTNANYGYDKMYGTNPAQDQGGGQNFPSALIRGGQNFYNVVAGVFALDASYGPSVSHAGVGFRCAR